MKNYRKKAGTEARLDYGMELAEGLKLFPETAGYAPDQEQRDDELEQAHEARRALRKPLVKKRVALRLANYTTDREIRAMAKAAESADGGRRGPIFTALFPEGLWPVVAPMGARQVKPTEALAGRLSKSKHPDVMAFAVEWQPKIDAAAAQISGAAAAHLAARKAHDGAFQTEVAVRDEHRRQVEVLMGHVRSAFPGDRVRQDLVFPSMVDDSPSSPSEEAGAPEGGEEPSDK